MAHSQEQKDAEAEFLRDRINNTCSNLEEIAGYLHESRFHIATMGLLLSLLASERALFLHWFGKKTWSSFLLTCSINNLG